MHRTPTEFGSRLVKFQREHGIVDSRGPEPPRDGDPAKTLGSDGRPAARYIDLPQLSLVRIEPRRNRFPFLQLSVRLLLLLLLAFAIGMLQLALLSAVAPALLRQNASVEASR